MKLWVIILNGHNLGRGCWISNACWSLIFSSDGIYHIKWHILMQKWHVQGAFAMYLTYLQVQVGWDFFSRHCICSLITWAFHSLHCHTSQKVIPMLPQAISTSSSQQNYLAPTYPFFWCQYRSSHLPLMHFLHVQTISTLSDPVSLLTRFSYWLSMHIFI